MVTSEMIKLATFDLIPTGFLDDLMFYFPEADAFSPNFEAAGVESTFMLSNMGFGMYLIYMNAFLVVAYASLHCCRNSCQSVKYIYDKISAYLFWNGLIRFYMELFFDLSLYSILNIHTVDERTAKFPSVQASNYFSMAILGLTCLFFVFLIAVYVRNYKDWDKEQFQDSYGDFIGGTDLKRRKKQRVNDQRWALLIYTVFFFARRLLFIVSVILMQHFFWG